MRRASARSTCGGYISSFEARSLRYSTSSLQAGKLSFESFTGGHIDFSQAELEAWLAE
jgi:hypothetical protein